jgi:membrane-associated phospholipid phosphatase
MVIPDVTFFNGSSTLRGMNPTFAYPIKLGGHLCFPDEMSQCLSDPSLDKPCCQELYDVDSWPKETVTVLEEFLIIFFSVLFVAAVRVQIWKMSCQRSGYEYSRQYWVLVFWDTLLGAFFAFEYSFFVTNFLKVSVSSPRPNYYAVKVYGSVHSNHRAPLRGHLPCCTFPSPSSGDSTKSFPSGHSATSMSTLGFLTFLSLEDVYLLSKTFSWNPHSTLLLLQLALVPLFLAVWICGSRIHDYFHFAADVLGTALLCLPPLLLTTHSCDSDWPLVGSAVAAPPLPPLAITARRHSRLQRAPLPLALQSGPESPPLPHHHSLKLGL